ncbi:hypothetical protein Tco_0829017 [Tanacetum coccineum]
MDANIASSEVRRRKGEVTKPFRAHQHPLPVNLGSSIVVDSGARGENATHGVVLAPWAGVFADGSSHQPPYLVLSN